MRARRPQLVGLVVATVLALAGPWTAASADDWPSGDPVAKQGVVLADVKVHAAAGIGYRLTLKKPGEVDLLKWGAITGTPQSDEGITDGVDVWDARTGSHLLYGYGDESDPSSDVYLEAAGRRVVDSRAATQPTSVIETIRFYNLPAGTYDIVHWVASNASHVETRFRLHAPKGSRLVRRIVSTRTFRLVQREFSGTASVHAGGYDESALVDESAHVTVRNKLFGAFQLPPYLVGILTSDTIPTGSYSGPSGTHQVAGDAMFSAAPAGAYTFTVDVGADGEPLVAGVDIPAP